MKTLKHRTHMDLVCIFRCSLLTPLPRPLPPLIPVSQIQELPKALPLQILQTRQAPRFDPILFSLQLYAQYAGSQHSPFESAQTSSRILFRRFQVRICRIG